MIVLIAAIILNTPLVWKIYFNSFEYIDIVIVNKYINIYRNRFTCPVFAFSILAFLICVLVNSLNVVGVLLFILIFGLYTSDLFLYPISPL